MAQYFTMAEHNCKAKIPGRRRSSTLPPTIAQLGLATPERTKPGSLPPIMSLVLLATAGYDSTVCLFDAGTRRMKRKVKFEKSTVHALAFSNGSKPVQINADSLYLAVAGFSHVAVYDLTATALGLPTFPKPLMVFKGHSANVVAVGFDSLSARPRFGYSASKDGWLKVWDTKLPARRGDPPPAGASMSTTDTLTEFKRPEDDGSKLTAVVLYIGPGADTSRNLEFNLGHGGENGEAVGETGRDDCGDVEIFITADSVGRLSMWDYGRRCLVATLRPLTVVKDEATKTKSNGEDGVDDKSSPQQTRSEGEEVGQRRFGSEADGSSAVGNTVEAGGRADAISSSATASDAGAGNPHSSSPLPRSTPQMTSSTPCRGEQNSCLNRYASPLETLELFSSADGSGTMLVTSDKHGNIFIYRVTEMLANERAPPYAAWSTDKLWSVPQEYDGDVFTTDIYSFIIDYISKVRVSQDGKTMACTLTTGRMAVYDLEKELPRFVAGDISEMTPYRDYSRRALARGGHPRLFRAPLSAWDVTFVGDANNYVIACGGNDICPHEGGWVHHISLEDDEYQTSYPEHADEVTHLAVKEVFS